MFKIKSTTLTIITLSIMITGSCDSQKNMQNDQNKSVIKDQNYKIEKIELTEQTRGTNRKVTFTPTSVITSLNGEVTTAKLAVSDWNNLSKQASLIDLEKISSYTSPTTDRFSDKALSSTIVIISNGNTYQSSEFDSGTPPKELQALYKLLKK